MSQVSKSGGGGGSPPAPEAVRRAYAKLAQGGTISESERRALKRFEVEKEEALRWRYYACVPQKHYRRMSGRQAKVLREQAIRYGIPCDGASVDLSQLIKAFHDFLARNAHLLHRDPPAASKRGDALEAYRRERTKLARLTRMEREAQLISREEVREGLSRIAALLRRAGEALQRQFGPAAGALLAEALDEAERDIELRFGRDEHRMESSDASGNPPDEA